MSRLNVYISQQLWKMLALSMTLITLIVFFSDTLFDFLKEMQDLGFPLSFAFRFLVLQIPMALAFAFPPSVFLTIFMVYSLLNQHFELIALRMNGLSLWRLFQPALVLGLLSGCLSFASTEWLIPHAQKQIAQLKEEVLTSSQLKLTKNGITLPLFKDGQWVKLIHAEKASLNHLEGFTFIQRSQSGNIEVIQAESADYQSPQWQLNGVQIYGVLAGNERFVVNRMARVQKSQLLDVDEDTLKATHGDFHHSQVSFKGLAERIQKARQSESPPPSKWVVMLWERIAQPLNCLALVFMAFPLALAPPRQSSAKGFTLAIVTLFALYIIRNISISLGQGGFLMFGNTLSFDTSVGVACLLPTLLLLGLGAWLIHRKSYSL